MNKELFDACERKTKGISNLSWNDLAQLFDIPSGKILKDRYFRAKSKMKFSETPIKYEAEKNNPIPEFKETLEMKEDGTQISDRLVEMSLEESKSPEFVLNAHGYDSDLWELVNASSNMWHGLRPDDMGLRVLMQSKIIVKPKTKSSLSLSDIDEFFNNFQWNRIAEISLTRQYKKGSQILEIDWADNHIGNESLPFSEIQKRTRNLVSEVISRCSGLTLEKIVLAQLGDVLHFDNYQRHTTSGTEVTYGGDYYTSFDNALDLFIWVVKELSSVAPVEVVNIYGNHDKVSSYALAKALEAFFKNDDNIQIDTSHEKRKFRKFGVSSVCFVHGDMPKKNLYSTFQKEGRKLFGETIFSEIHVGHLHHEIASEEHGVIVRYVPSITLPDEWHVDNGYTGAKQGTHCFLWDQQKGLSDIWMIPC